MKTDKIKTMASGDEAFAVGTWLSAEVREPSNIVEHTIMLSKGNTVRCAVFPAKGITGAQAPVVAPPSWKIGQRVIMTGLRVTVSKGYLNASAVTVEAVEQ